MSTTYDVRIHQTEVYKGKRTTTFYVRWTVAGKRRREGFRAKALAESFRAELVTAARRGEAFDVDSGLPISMRREQQDMSWYEFACVFVDMKWSRAAATTRRTNAEALTAVSTALFTTDRGKPDDKLIRSALCRWAFNTNRRNDPNQPGDVAAALRWLERHTQPVVALTKPEVLRPVLDGLTVRLDGQPYAPSVVNRRRKILSTAMEYAVERKLLTKNPIPALKWTAPKSVHAVDRRSVANPVQARTLLTAVGTHQRSGPRLVAFFGCLYFAAMRPEEAVALAKHNLSLPAEGWGELTIDTAEPHAGKEWTDSGANRDRRQLKQRARGETRTMPCPPELTALLHSHIRQFGTAADGRLFTGERNGQELPKLTIVRAWQRARAEVFTPEVAATPLAGTPYDLRHAAVSTWLNGGVPAVTVAEWAGHSVEVLLKIYAKCLDGEAVTVRQRVQAALGFRE
ncbi:tyrosine-type recombinase/integrase [Saccharothrix sp. NRRL B-16314]|uniref:tyrosine-type recombinase/integrase n=1 Tax=Saccharothrix sp. NRRL B-16314 TaxID=1463825 RepID=UPI000525E577|nr:tyrosine-type recombinase/integrase [Saccharothrix sp. NRRL B-16314]